MNTSGATVNRVEIVSMYAGLYAAYCLRLLYLDSSRNIDLVSFFSIAACIRLIHGFFRKRQPLHCSKKMIVN